MDEMKVIYGFLVIDIMLIILIAMLFFLIPENLECEDGDKSCLTVSKVFREACTPSTTIITIGNSTNYIKMRITVYREGDKCFIKEEVIEDCSSGIEPVDLTGYDNICNLTDEELEKYGPHACQGSLFDFVVSSDDGGDGGGFGGETPESEIPHI